MGKTLNKPPHFNVRVYGVWIEDGQLLYTKEQYKGKEIVKFPGGGLHYGEGLKDALKREFREETRQEIEVKELFYVNDFFVSSYFDDSQVIAFYYWVSEKNSQSLNSLSFISSEENPNHYIEYKLVKLQKLSNTFFTFDTDKTTCQLILDEYIRKR